MLFKLSHQFVYTLFQTLLPIWNLYAINLFGVVFSRMKLSEEEKRHEYIHTLQQREMLFLFFYIWYVMEWLVKLAIYRNMYRAYINISFEKDFRQARLHCNYSRF